MQHTSRTNNQGFTISELLITIMIMTLVLTVFVASLITMINTTAEKKLQLELALRSQSAMERIEQDVRYSFLFLPTIPSGFTDNYGKNNLGTNGVQSWNIAGVPAANNDRVLILKSYATTEPAGLTLRDTVYIKGKTYNCGSQMRYNDQLPYITIYFLRNGDLYRRLLTVGSVDTCRNESQSQRQTCPPENMSGARCQARDEKIASDVSSFSVEYLNANRDPINTIYTSTNPERLIDAETAVVTLEMSRTMSGRAIKNSTVLSITKVNREEK